MWSYLKRSTFLAAVLICGLLAAPAADASDTTADATADESAHAINEVMLADSSGEMLSAPVHLNPKGTYRLEVNVSDNNLLADIDRVEAVLYYDADGTAPVPTEGHPSTAAVLSWNREASPEFALDAGGSSTWSLNTEASSTPPDEESTGSWSFEFTVGDVAHETETALDNWKLQITVADINTDTDITRSTDLFNSSEHNFALNHYSRLEEVTSSVSFGMTTPGCILPNSPLIDLKAIANGSYNIEIAVDPTWTGSAGHSLSSVTTLSDKQQIRVVGKGADDLRYDTATYGDPSLQPLSPAFAPLEQLTSVSAPTQESGADHDVKLTARFSDVVREATYQGIIYLIVTDSSGDS